MTHNINCEKCGKKLLERKSNGVWKLRFGRRGEKSEPIVDLEIVGSLKMKCLRRSCGHVNILNFFPSQQCNPISESRDKAKIITKIDLKET